MPGSPTGTLALCGRWLGSEARSADGDCAQTRPRVPLSRGAAGGRRSSSGDGGRMHRSVQSAILMALCLSAQTAPLPARWAVVVDPAIGSEARWATALNATFELLGPRGQVGLAVPEDGTGFEAVPLGSARDPGHRKALARRLAGLEPKAEAFPLADGLAAALRILGARDPAHEDHVWLVTAGSVAPPTEGADLESLLSDAAVRGVHVQVFAPGSSLARLGPSVRRTGGEVHSIDEDRLLESFIEPGLWLAGTERLILDGGAMWVDDQVDQLAVWMFEGGQRARIVRPDEVELTPSRPRAASWTSTPWFHQVNLTDPPYGAWRLEQGLEVDRAAVVIQHSDLRLALSLDPAVPVVGAPVRIRAALLEEGRPVVSYARLKALRFTLEWNDTELVLAAAEDGIHEARWTPEETGAATVTLRARSPDVQRALTRRIQVQPACVDVDADFLSEEVQVRARLRASCRDLREVSIDVATVSDAGQGSWARLQPDGRGGFERTVPRPEGLQRVVFEGRALSRLGERVVALPSISVPPSSFSWLRAVGWVASQVPLLLGLIAWWFVRREVDVHEFELYMESEDGDG